MFGSFGSYGIATSAEQLRPLTSEQLDVIRHENFRMMAPAVPTLESIRALANYRMEQPIRPLDEINSDFAAFKIRLSAALAERAS